MISIDGAKLYSNYFDTASQRQLLHDVMSVIAAAPLYRPTMPLNGKPFSVRMTNCGPLGWLSDPQGYRYQRHHPQTGQPWPPIPDRLLKLWQDLANYPAPPEACLVNYYDGEARMGLHQDADEAAREAPVLSVSLGDTALFRLGGQRRGDPTGSFKLASGDVLLLTGAARQAFHGVDRIYAGSSRLLPQGGRFNLTLRRVTLP